MTNWRSEKNSARGDEIGRRIAIAAPAALTLVLAAALMWGCEQRIIYDAHEHIQSFNEAPTMLAAMDACGVKTTILMGSARCTITMNPKDGFTQYHENNLDLLKIQRAYPGRFMPFPTIDPEDPEKLDKLKFYVAQGARGLKLYLGHGWSYKDGGETKYVFHRMPLDDPRMEPVYDYCEEIGLPICFHVNNQMYFAELNRVLAKHPDMIVNCPHFMLLSRTDNGSLQKLIDMLETYPNLYTDISFGRVNVVKKYKVGGEGFYRFSGNAEVYRNFITKYRDRIFFGADMVINPGGYKDAEWITKMLTGYINFLEEKTFTFSLPITGTFSGNGMYLDDETLDYIYRKNFLRVFPPDKEFRDKAN